MAIKSIIEIPVEDKAFEKFKKSFEDYEKKVKELPQDWAKVQEGADAATKASVAHTRAIIAAMGAASAVVVEELEKAAKAQGKLESATRRSEGGMQKLHAAAKAVSATVFSIGKKMLEFGLIGAGVIGVGGLFGLSELPYAAVTRQRSARGAGLTPGQQASLQTYFNQFGNVDSAAMSIANARNDVTKRWIFSGLGIGQNDLNNASNFTLTEQALRNAQRIVKAAPDSDWLNVAQARGLTQIFSPETLRNLRLSSSGSVAAAIAAANSDAGKLGFSSKTAQDWTNFSNALHRAGVEIESSLIVGLDKFTPLLTRVSHHVADWISAFAKGPEIGKWTKKLADGLSDAFAFIASGKLQGDMVDFVDDIEILTKALGGAIKFFGIGNKNPDFPSLAKAAAEPGGAATAWAKEAIKYRRWQGYYDPKRIADLAAQDDKKYGLPAGTMGRLAMIESSFGANQIGPMTPSGQAVGVWQMMPGTAKALTNQPRYNEVAEGDAAARYLSALYKHYGSWRKAVAAYNWGPGKLDADIKAHGKKWFDYLPNQTKAEVSAVVGSNSAKTDSQISKLVGAIKGQKTAPAATVIVQNQSSARVSVQAQGAAY